MTICTHKGACCTKCLHKPQARHWQGFVDACQSGFRVLEADFETLALIGTQFADAFVTTVNDHALITGRGGYAPLQMAGTRWRVSSRRVTVRFTPGGKDIIAHAVKDTNQKTPETLHLFDQNGYLQHRVELPDHQDAFLAQTLPCEPQTQPEMQSKISNVVSFCAVRTLRQCWDERMTGCHMDSILGDGGITRHRSLLRLGDGRARRICADVIGHFLRHLVKMGISFTRTVPAKSLMQSDSGPLLGIFPQGDLLIMRSAAALATIDVGPRCECWVTRYGDKTQAVEIYAPDGNCIIILTADLWEPASTWNTLLASLPSV